MRNAPDPLAVTAHALAATAANGWLGVHAPAAAR